MSDLKRKSINAIIWNLIEKYGIQVVKLILGVILARLLMPKDYGLYGIVTVLISVSIVFVNAGFGQAYIQNKEANENDASTIFYFNLLIAILLYIIIWFFSPFLATYFEQPELKIIARILSLVLIINAFGMMQITMLIKAVNFKTKTIVSLFSSLLAGVSAIYAAYNQFGVWSLVVQSMLGSILNTLGLWMFYNWRPSIVFSINSIKRMFNFSSWVLLTSLFNSVFNNLYMVVIGKLYHIDDLGYYTNSKQYQMAVSQQPTSAIGAVSFPVFSKLQNDKLVMKETLKKFIQQTLFFLSPVIVTLIVIADPLFLFLLTEKWLPMVPYFQLLLVVGYLYPIMLLNSQLINSMGNSKYNFKVSIFQNLLRIINIFISFNFGVFYIILGELVITLIIVIINMNLTKMLIGYEFWRQVLDLIIIIFISVISFSIGCCTQYVSSDMNIKILIGVFGVITSYILLSYIFNRVIFIEFINNIKNLNNK